MKRKIFILGPLNNCQNIRIDDPAQQILVYHDGQKIKMGQTRIMTEYWKITKLKIDSKRPRARPKQQLVDKVKQHLRVFQVENAVETAKYEIQRIVIFTVVYLKFIMWQVS